MQLVRTRPGRSAARRLAASATAGLVLAALALTYSPEARGAAPDQAGTTLVGWGDNMSSQLGEGLTGGVVPRAVNGLADVVKLEAGSGHTVALTRDGSSWAWGRNNFGQVGDGTTVNRSTPVKLPLRDLADVAAGGGTTLAVTRDGGLWAWGFNLFGQIGDGTGGPGPNIIKPSPVRVPGLDRVVDVATGGGHSFARTRDGAVWAWGRNLQGQLGDGTTTDRFRPVRVAGIRGATAVVAGNGDGFALLRDGTVRAWGWNIRGQLGDGTTETRFTPVAVKGLRGVTQVSAAYHHTVALLGDGTVRTWGQNDQGQLGDGSTTTRLAPVPVPGLRGVRAVSANGGGEVDAPGGTGHSFALLRDGTVRAWGANGDGQLGDGTTAARLQPVPVRELRGVVEVHAGGEVPPSRPGPAGSYSMALGRDGRVWSWGDNVIGQLGDGPSLQPRLRAGAIRAGLPRIRAVDSGQGHTLALSTSGELWSWGRNVYGQLGDGTTMYRSSPVRVAGLRDVVEFATGAGHSLALTRDGTLWAWGANGDGQLGDGSTAARLRPVRVGAALRAVTALVAGGDQTFVLLRDGAVWGWGDNDNGQLGDGSTTDRADPVSVKGLRAVGGVAAGQDHTLAVLRDGTVRAWGRNDRGQLGDGTTTARRTPVTVAGLRGVDSVAAASHHSAALLDNGTVRAWGVNDRGQVGDGGAADRTRPTRVYRLAGVRAIALGSGGINPDPGATGHGLALLADGTIRAWGVNDNGQLGDGTVADRTTSVPVAGLRGVVSMDAAGGAAPPAPGPGGAFSTALTRDGTVHAWGDNGNGQLGDGAPILADAPQEVDLGVLGGMANVQKIEAGYGQVLALTRDGGLWGWGRNTLAQLGDGSRTSRPQPVRINLPQPVVAFDAGGGHSLAVTADGSVWSWGFNLWGQLGLGTGGEGPAIIGPVPAKIPGLTGVRAVAAAGGHSLALTNDGAVWGWGLNAVGELGDGTKVNRWSPVRVQGLPPNVTEIASGGGGNLALTEAGNVWSWGDNRSGQSGVGSFTESTPTRPVEGLDEVQAISSGYHHNLALLRDGTVRAWGLNDKGQLGDGTRTNRALPVPVSGLGGVRAVAANGGGDDVAPPGYGFSMALLSDGTVRAWGHNDRGQLGDGTTIDRLTPVEVKGLSGVKAIVAGGNAPVTRPGSNGAYAFAVI